VCNESNTINRYRLVLNYFHVSSHEQYCDTGSVACTSFSFQSCVVKVYFTLIISVCITFAYQVRFTLTTSVPSLPPTVSPISVLDIPASISLPSLSCSSNMNPGATVGITLYSSSQLAQIYAITVTMITY
jgi:hypothetical protein